MKIKSQETISLDQSEVKEILINYLRKRYPAKAPLIGDHDLDFEQVGGYGSGNEPVVKAILVVEFKEQEKEI